MKNLSAEPINKLYSWLPHDLKAEKVVILPDACPGKSPLPTGTAIRLNQTNWREFAVSDVGCGMRLLRSNLDGINLAQWNEVANILKANKGKIGDLGGGNHFLDALLPYSEDRIHFLIHTGSRKESGLVDAYVDTLFLREQSAILLFAKNHTRIEAVSIRQTLWRCTFPNK